MSFFQVSNGNTVEKKAYYTEKRLDEKGGVVWILMLTKITVNGMLSAQNLSPKNKYINSKTFFKFRHLIFLKEQKIHLYEESMISLKSL